MIQRIRAVFRDGNFVPEEAVELPEGTAVDLLLAQPNIVPPAVGDPAERRRLLNELVDRMQERVVTSDASLPTRDELHERR